jgi:hypothetical protein
MSVFLIFPNSGHRYRRTKNKVSAPWLGSEVGICHAVNAKGPTSLLASHNVRLYLKQTKPKHIEDMCIKFCEVMEQTATLSTQNEKITSDILNATF